MVGTLEITEVESAKLLGVMMETIKNGIVTSGERKVS